MSAVGSTWGASRLVANWRPAQVANPFDHMGEASGATYALEYVGGAHEISVRFTEMPGHPEWMRVRATNWRCEDEPNGIYARADARKFYRALLAGGFTVRP